MGNGKNMHFSSASSTVASTHYKTWWMKKIVFMENDANDRKKIQEIPTDN